MKIVLMDGHDFNKINLVTTTKGDQYQCSSCGAIGWRVGLSDHIRLTAAEFKKTLKCEANKTFFNEEVEQQKLNNRPKEVITNNLPYIGIECGVHKVVDCPKEYDKYKNDVWVFSKKRNEPVKLLPHEYEIC